MCERALARPLPHPLGFALVPKHVLHMMQAFACSPGSAGYFLSRTNQPATDFRAQPASRRASAATSQPWLSLLPANSIGIGTMGMHSSVLRYTSRVTRGSLR